MANHPSDRNDLQDAAPIVLEWIPRWVRVVAVFPLLPGIFLLGLGLWSMFLSHRSAKDVTAFLFFGGFLTIVSLLFITATICRVVDRHRGVVLRRIGAFGLVWLKAIPLDSFTVVAIGCRKKSSYSLIHTVGLGGCKKPGDRAESLNEYDTKEEAMKSGTQVGA
jgi:hypothetical protein